MKIMHWVGIDDHADKWTIAHFIADAQEPANVFELIPDAKGYRRLIAFLKGLGKNVRVAYEAGPCGFDLYRRLTKAKIDCKVAAPSLTPTKPGERVKTNRKDAKKIARCHRSGDLTYVTVPDEQQESLRDLIRQRASVKRDVGRTQRQIIQMLLRYGHRYREGKSWTQRFWSWLRKVRLEGAHSQFVLDENVGELEHRIEQLKRFDQEIAEAARQPEYATYVNALRVLRGIETLSAMTLLSELGDLRRFASAPQMMAAVGLVPGESSTGDKTNRLSITKTGNAHVRHIAVEAAWHYQRGAKPGRTIRARRVGQPPEVVAIAEKCDKRLSTKFYRLTSRRKKSTVAAVAVARELIGFIWAIGQKIHPGTISR
ncbi:MAG TPA: IS110 family transposase [Thermoanaerobaculia bacterium]